VLTSEQKYGIIGLGANNNSYICTLKVLTLIIPKIPQKVKSPTRKLGEKGQI